MVNWRMMAGAAGLALLAGCGSSVPSEHAQFRQDWITLRDAAKEASSNCVVQEKVMASSASFFDALKGKPVNGWVAKVDKVVSDKYIEASAGYPRIEFKLRIAGGAQIGALRDGDDVQFTGRIE